MKKIILLLLTISLITAKDTFSQSYGTDERGCPVDENGLLDPYPSMPNHCWYAPGPGFPGNPNPIQLEEVPISHPNNPSNPTSPWFPWIDIPISPIPGTAFLGNPCDAIALFANKSQIKNKLQELKNSTNLNYEKGFLLYGENYIPIQGQANGASINFNVYGRVNGLIHSHYQNLLSIFSYSDITAMATLYSQNLMEDPKTFTMGVVSTDAQYFLMIENQAQFQSFIQNTVNNDIAGFQDALFTTNYGINTGNSVGQNELGFTYYLEHKNTGLKLFRGDSQFNNWQPIKKENNQVVNNPCQ